MTKRTEKGPEPDLSEGALRKLFYSLSPGEVHERALMRTVWKDGIDLELPNGFFRLLADGIAALVRAEGSAADLPDDPIAWELFNNDGTSRFTNLRAAAEEWSADYGKKVRPLYAQPVADLPAPEPHAESLARALVGSWAMKQDEHMSAQRLDDFVAGVYAALGKPA